ncbi:hypothetical protein RJT34_32118 [Clitoria ternatea]|uniref:Bulb-type lectin domain-containing protein n=1 Tax=Clitoria ternatea TaxID=43366 RepID=A0AAN9EVH4_CLITE
MSLGSSLSTLQNNTLISPSGDFAFGFQQKEKDGFLLAIWFNKIPDRTIVCNEIAHAALLDTGNLVLVAQNSVTKWQSFDYPTDTILPGQVLSENLDSPRLVSRYQENNFSKGRFQFTLEKDGNLVLYTQHFPLDLSNYAYWSSQISGSKFSWVFNQSGYIFLQFDNGTIINIISSSNLSTRNFYQRAILEYDGVFRHYVYPKSTSSSKEQWSNKWTVSSSTPSNICQIINGKMGSGACGFNSYCTFDESQTKACHCPPGYSFIDPNDVMKGCKQNFVSQSCDQDFPETHLFDMSEMQNMDWVDSEYAYYKLVNEDWCRQACLEDCFCAAAIFSNGQECWKKKQPLSNGRVDAGVRVKALIKIRKANFTLTPGVLSKETHRSNSKLVIIGSVLLGSSGILNVMLILANFYANADNNDDLIILADWAYDCFKDGNVRVLVEDDMEALDDMKRVERYVMTAIWCIQEDPSLRPTMKKVLLMLEGSVGVPIPPDPASL